MHCDSIDMVAMIFVTALKVKVVQGAEIKHQVGLRRGRSSAILA